ncbi:MAG: ABC transporter permease [Desulfobulbaceae bacterium]|nr:ABC transporter permease [Desulfobulbaceae bacterium]
MQRKLRSALSVIGVIFGVMAVLTMVSIGEGAKRETLRKIERLGIRNIYIRPLQLTGEEQRLAEENLSPGLNENDANLIEKIARSVEAVTIYHEIVADFHDGEQDFSPKIASCSANYPSIYKIKLARGRFFTPLDNKDYHNVCVLGSNAAEKLAIKGQLGNKISMGDMQVTVIGVLESQHEVKNDDESILSLRNHDDMILLPRSIEKYFFSFEKKKEVNPRVNISELIVKVKEDIEMTYAVKEVKSLLAKLHNNVPDYQVVVPQQLLNQARQTRRIFNIVLGSIAAISLVVGGIGIMNVMLATVTERTKEIGIRRAVGARRIDIIIHFLIESSLLTVTGGVAGIVFGIIATGSISYFARWPTAITGYTIVIPFLLSCFIGIFFGLYPAHKAASMSPINALRQD